MNIAKLKQHTKVFTRLFGISPDKFDTLVEKVSPLWVKAEAKRLRHPRKIKQGCSYSGKKKAHTIKTQIVADNKGDIRHILASVPGNIHDKKLFDQSGVALPNHAKGDLGYLGTNLTIPFKSSKLHSLTQRQKDHNTRHSRKRIVVEHVFASLKAYRILADRFRGSLINYHSYFLIACGLRNLTRT